MGNNKGKENVTQYVNLEKWRGRRDAVELDPAAMQFTTRPAPKHCRGCLFDRQSSKVCERATEVAWRAGLGHCERDGVIYVAVVVDPRQLDIDESK